MAKTVTKKKDVISDKILTDIAGRYLVGDDPLSDLRALREAKAGGKGDHPAVNFVADIWNPFDHADVDYLLELIDADLHVARAAGGRSEEEAQHPKMGTLSDFRERLASLRADLVHTITRQVEAVPGKVIKFDYSDEISFVESDVDCYGLKIVEVKCVLISEGDFSPRGLDTESTFLDEEGFASIDDLMRLAERVNTFINNL